MTILFFSRLFYPHIGGVETHVLEIGKRLVNKGHRVIVITEEYQSNGSSANKTGEVYGIEILRIPAIGDSGLVPRSGSRQNDGGKKFRIWLQLFKLIQLIKNADIIHCHDVFFWYLPFRFIFPNKKVFTTFHGYETKFPPSKKAILIRKISEKLSWGNICAGDYIKKWYGTKPDFVTYGGVDEENQKSKIKNQKYNSKLKILFIGRLEEDTGVLIYLKALELLRQKKIEYELEACGDGHLRSSVEKYGKAHGFAKDLNQYIEKADLVFASSYLSILQALMYKKLVFAVYDNPLKEDYLKMAPFAKWIVIEDSAEGLANKILHFTEYKNERQKIVNKGFQWVKKQTWENVTNMYLDLWRIPFRYSYSNTGSLKI